MTDASYFMEKHQTIFNPYFRPNGEVQISLGDEDWDKCRKKSALDLGTNRIPVIVNFYNYNERCRKVDVDGFIEKALSHEAFGTTGGNGHESQRRIQAGAAGNDPYVIVERIVAGDSTALLGETRTQVTQAELRISLVATSHNIVTNNFSGSRWVFDGDSLEFTEFPFDF